MRVKQVIKSYLNHDLIRSIIMFVIFITISSSPVSGEALYHKVTWLLVSLMLVIYQLDKWTDVSHKILEDSELLCNKQLNPIEEKELNTSQYSTFMK